MKIGPKYKICRRLGARVFGKCQTTGFSISGSAQGGKNQQKGRGPKRGRRGGSDYGLQLIEKQKIRYTYGLKEHQFASYVKTARALQATTGVNPVVSLAELLEARLDNVVFRLGLAKTRAFARQLVSHGHILVNGRRLNVPSYQVKTGDRVAVRPESKVKGPFRPKPAEAKTEEPVAVPSWLQYDEAAQAGSRKGRLPAVAEFAPELNFGAVLEFYSRV
jgi:small subunit ribosomal protein S4